jgi:cGMP-dependent protein kinase
MVGKGTFGNVYLCCNRSNKMLYALKSVSRKKISFHSLQESLKQERKILQVIEHQFIIKLVKTFKDTRRIYFLLEYVQGLSLFEVLRIINLVPSKDCQFFAACLVVILEYLHKVSVVYRDLKPENIMVDHEGYLKLLDFGTAKIIKDRTFSVIGTPQYMAPEVILGKGYSFSADLWGLGVMIFEFICGSVPFGGNEDEDAFTVYREIVSGLIRYPSFVKENARERTIIETLLNNYPPSRGSAETLKSHKYFKGFKWDDLLSRKLTPPYVPKVEVEERTVEASIIQNRTIQQILNNQGDSSFKSLRKVKDSHYLGDWDKDF